MFASDLIYVEPVFFGFKLITDEGRGQLKSPIAQTKKAHPSGTWKDVNLNPVSSFFAPETPRGILAVSDFDFGVAYPQYLFDPFSTNRFYGLGPFALAVYQRKSTREYD